MAAVVKDASSLNPVLSYASHNTMVIDRASLILKTNGKDLLDKLDEFEMISIIFLVLDEENLTRRAFTLCQYISSGQGNECIEEILTIVQTTNGQLDAIVEALYIIGRYDLLEDHLGITADNNLHNVFSEVKCIGDERKALYCVFAGMPQEEADRLVHSRLMPGWYYPETERPLEETFVRNLFGDNYQYLINEIFKALVKENKESLASYLRPYTSTEQPYQHPRRQASQTPQFNEDICYPLPTTYPHGLCVIINVKDFIKPKTPDCLPLLPRHGSEIDKARLSATFKLFGFHVMYFDNPDNEKIKQFFKKLRTDPGLKGIACLAVCMMTHGDEEDNIYLHDRSCLPVTDLRKLCFSSALHGKPRLYFVQACRGEDTLRPIFLQQDSSVVTTQPARDCLISAATVKGYSAFRNQTEGSWYITDLCQSLQEFGHLLPIKNVLHKTRKSLADRVGTMNNAFVTQLSEDKDTLTKDVQFVRAEVDCFVDGIIDLVQLELLEKLVEETLEQGLAEQEQTYN